MTIIIEGICIDSKLFCSCFPNARMRLVNFVLSQLQVKVIVSIDLTPGTKVCSVSSRSVVSSASG